jgi:probable HAF family extracellular repeat protein
MRSSRLMSRTGFRRLIGASVLIGLTVPLYGLRAAAEASPVPPRYEVTDLGTLGSSSVATGVNNAGVAVGWSTVGAARHATRYQSGTVTDLGTLGGGEATARAVNSGGVITGSAALPSQTNHAFRWNGAMTDLGTLSSPSAVSNGSDINDAGDVVGGSYNSQGWYHPFRSSGGVMSDLGALGNQAATSYASGTNNNGDVVGSSQTNGIGSPFHAFLVSGLYTGGVIADLGTLGGTHSGANEMNDTGVIVGWSQTSSGSSHAFVTVFGGAMVDIGTLGGSTSEALAVNSDNVVVGYSETTNGALHAFVHDGFAMKDLNAMIPAGSGWELTKAWDISDTGFIVGEGLHNGVTTAFRLTPVPDMSISDAAITEGNSGTRVLRFTVSLTQPVNQPVSVQYATGDYNAVAPSDYVATSGTLMFNPLETSKTISVTVNGDTRNEADEVFLVGLANPVHATVVDGIAVGKIVNDDPLPSLRVNDVSLVEGNSGTRAMTFSIRLSAASGRNVTVKYATANGSATAPSDYASRSGTVQFTPGQTVKTVAVTIKGDTVKEANETLKLNLSAAMNATIGDPQGIGTITNDD